MNTSHICTAAALAALLFAASGAQAQNAKPCIELTNQAQVEQEYTDAQGKQAKRLVAPGKVVPGNEIVYVVTAKNTCGQPASNVVINNPVPAQMNYVANSASGANADISYSLDGNSFAKLAALSAKNADGSPRAARADEVRNIRWTLTTAINAGQSASVLFRATVK